MSAGSDSGSRDDQARRALTQGARTLAVVLVLAILGVAIAGRLYFDAQKAMILREKAAELAGIRDLKIDEIRSLRANLVADARVAATDPAARDEVERWLADRSGAEAESMAFLDNLVEIRELSGATIVTSDEARWVGSTNGEPPTERDLVEVRQVVASGEATLSDLFLDSRTGSPQWDAMAPMRTRAGRIFAVVILRADPHVRLYPLIQGWPTPSPTSETLLVRGDGDAVLFLNDLRFEAGAALKKRVSLTNEQVLGVQALRGGPRVVEGIDYRGTPVVGAVGAIPGTLWRLVAKIDKSEAYAGVVERQRTILVIAALSSLLVGLGIMAAWRQQAVAFYRTSLEGERSRKLLAAQYEFLNSSVNDVVVLVDREGCITQVNRRAEALYGYDSGELLRKAFDDLEDPDAPYAGTVDWENVPEKGATLLELHQMTKDGAKIITESSVASLEVDGGSAALIVSRDVTERKRLEADLRDASESLEKLIGEANAPIIVWDPERNITRFNRAFERLTGRTADEVFDRGFSVLFPQETRERGLLVVEEATRGTNYDAVEIPVAHLDGRVHTVLWNIASTYADEEHEIPLAIIAQGQDITDRKRAEQLLARSEAMFRSIVESSPTAMYIYRLATDGRLVLEGANPAADALIRIRHEELLGLEIEEAFPNLVGTPIPDMYRSVAREEIGPQSFEIPYEDDRFAGYFSVTVFATEPGSIVVDFVDISERKRAEQQLLERTEELVESNAELEKFAYIASHDLQEPLRMIASYTQLLQKRYEGQLDADADEFIGYAVDGAHRLQNLINELLAYSRVGRQGSAFTHADLEPVLERVLSGLEYAIEESGATVTHDPMPTVWCDPTQIGQVLQNLIGNAIKFHGEDPPTVHIGANCLDRQWVFSVQDNGIGVEEEYFDRIFVIFQRLQSRERYQGTGLGLAICKRIIVHHGGRIWMESTPGAGSTFFFTLGQDGKART